MKTDNSFFEEKVNLRLQSISKIDKKEIKVLEAFGGTGKLWKEVQKRTDVKINSLRIDKEKGKPGIYLKGDNLKFLPSLPLERFDVIDLDAYGSPTKQLKIVFDKKYCGIVHFTFIQSFQGNLPHSMLIDLGYTKEMIKKVPSLFNQNGHLKFRNWLSLHNVTEICVFEYMRKMYGYFNMHKYNI